MAQTIKTSACHDGDPGSIPGSGRYPGEGNGNPLQYSCLENSMDGGAWWATVHWVAKSQTGLNQHSIFQGETLQSIPYRPFVPFTDHVPSSLPTFLASLMIIPLLFFMVFISYMYSPKQYTGKFHIFSTIYRWNLIVIFLYDLLLSLNITCLIFPIKDILLQAS